MTEKTALGLSRDQDPDARVPTPDGEEPDQVQGAGNTGPDQDQGPDVRVLTPGGEPDHVPGAGNTGQDQDQDPDVRVLTPGGEPDHVPGAGNTGPDQDPAAEADPGPAETPGSAADAEHGGWFAGVSRSVRARRGLVGVVAGAVLLAGAGGTLLYRAHELRTDPAAGNHALTDVEATTRVNGDVSSALAKVFSYTPGGTEATARSARTALSGRAAQQYTRLFAQVEKNVRSEHVTLTTQSVRVGTVSLRGSTAHLLVFLDQTARRGTKKPTTSAAQLSVTARLHDDVWQIVDIKAR
ncbi:hypothetical protein [Streptomyces sp. NPDC006552]|uniref:hypothetical protein n=1 Tax=Streptomyces sp. NPDC006552 TaxID=3157179 RepID=UPI0033A1A395